MFRSTLVLLFALLYSLLSAGVFTAQGHSRILLLTAHPDDECLFFAPTILGLLKAQHPPELFSLCLSVGNADGLGNVRREELARSLDVLGVSPDQRWIVDHPDLQDNFTASWDAVTIANVLRPYILDNNIDTIFTFDYEGVSSHPNHKSLPHGAMQFARSRREEGHTAPRIYTLITVSLLAKYTTIFAPLLVKLKLILCNVVGLLVGVMGREGALGTGLPLPGHGPSLGANDMAVYISGIPEYIRALQAMRMHVSQLVWFRWLYVSFSRYMWVNEWLEVTVH